MCIKKAIIPFVCFLNNASYLLDSSGRLLRTHEDFFRVGGGAAKRLHLTLCGSGEVKTVVCTIDLCDEHQRAVFAPPTEVFVGKQQVQRGVWCYCGEEAAMTGLSTA